MHCSSIYIFFNCDLCGWFQANLSWWFIWNYDDEDFDFGKINSHCSLKHSFYPYTFSLHSRTLSTMSSISWSEKQMMMYFSPHTASWNPPQAISSLLHKESTKCFSTLQGSFLRFQVWILNIRINPRDVQVAPSGILHIYWYNRDSG